MSNSLRIELIEFKTVSNDEVHCGIYAQDNDETYACQFSKGWESFKSEFPTVESLMKHIERLAEFPSLWGNYTVDGLVVKLDADCPYDAVVIDGVEQIYGKV
ncbi:hypothetical protein ACYPKM_02200 [Pseudomonas aeruginosa]